MRGGDGKGVWLFMEDRSNVVSRWLVALTVVFIPLSIFILISGPWGANYIDLQWTRYLLFASWVSLTLSFIVGIANMVTFPSERSEQVDEVPPPELEEGSEALKEWNARLEKSRKNAISSKNALMLAQATTFMLGLILYVAFISWMLLPKITLGAF